MKRRVPLNLTAGLIVLAGSLAACAGPSDSAHVSSPPTTICPEPTECQGNNPQANIRANNAYRDYQSLSPTAPPLAAGLLRQVRKTLDDIRRMPPVTEQSAQLALHKAFPSLSTTASASAARIPEGIGYAVTIPSGDTVQCIHGWVSARGEDLTVSGPTAGEGCLPLLGH